MLELTHQSTANAIKRAHELRCHVRRITDEEFAVRCANPEHKQGHVVHVQRRGGRGGGFFAECSLANGEPCPAALGKRVCYHITATLPLFLLLEAYRREQRKLQLATAEFTEWQGHKFHPALPEGERRRIYDQILSGGIHGRRAYPM